jgi:hypothetical protein
MDTCIVVGSDIACLYDIQREWVDGHQTFTNQQIRHTAFSMTADVNKVESPAA